MGPILDRRLFAQYRPRRRVPVLPLLALAAVIFAASGVAALQTVGGGGELSDLALRARGFFDPLAQPAALSAAAAEVEGTSTAAYAENGFSETPAAQEIAAATSSPQQPVVYQQTIEQPVVEKIMYEAPTSSAVTEGEFDAALGALETQINQLSLQNSAELVGAYQAASYVPAQTSGASSGSGSSSVDWGDISGTLSNQSDLQSALDQELALADWYATTSAPQLTTLANLSLPYAQVTGAPTVPTTTSDLINDSGFVTSSFSTTSADFWQSQTNFFSTSSADDWLADETTDDLPQGSTNEYYSSLLFAGSLAGTTTDALAEGSTNLYFTDARAQSAISVAGAPLTYSAGSIGIDEASGSQSGYLSASDWTDFNGKLASTSLSAGSGISYDSSTGQIANTGVVSNTGDWAGTLSGEAGSYYLSNSFSTTSASYFLNQNQSAAFSTTSAQYFLAQNQDLAFSTTSAAYWQSQTNFFSTSSADDWLADETTDDLPQGSTNEYYSSLLFAGSLAGTTTDALAEGSTNLYFTDARAQSAISVAGAPLTYSAGSIGIDEASGSQSGYLSASDWTDFNGKLASTSLSAGSGISYDSSTGQIANTGVVSNTGDWAGTLSGEAGSYYLSNSFSTTSASYFLNQNQSAAFSTTSAQYFLAQNQDLAFSTTSAAYWQSQTNFFSTSSASYFLNQDQTSAFSTSSASYFLAQNQPLAFSTTSASYFLAQNQTSSSTSTIGYLTATTTNATSTFAGGLAAGVSGLVYNWATGFTGVGTANPARLFTVFGASGNPQERISYSGSAYTELQTDAAGDFLIAPTSGIMEISSGNLEVCSNDVCATPTVALSGEGNLTVDNRLVAGSLEEACPSGYIWVPGDDKYGTLPGFCTMKYDASDSGGTAVSSASGVPWVSISQTSAIAQCDALGPGYHLMSDEEWMTIADETTALPINDMTGSQDFATGMSDSYVSSAQSAGDSGTDPVVSGCNFMEPLSNSANAYVADSCEERGDGTGGTTDADKGFYATGSDFTSASYSAGAAGPAQLRTKILPDGAVIWDFGGNVWDWTDATIYESNSSGASASSEEPDAGSWSSANWYDYTSITDYKGLNYIRPDITTWTAATNGIGEIYLNTGTGHFAFFRGGRWDGGAMVGPFALFLGSAPSYTDSGVGFRCSYSAP